MDFYLPSWLFIIVGLSIFLIGNIVTYSIGAGLGHIRPILPFISSTGTQAPENGIFVINFALTAFFFFFTFYIRYLHAKKVVKKTLLFSIANFIVLLAGFVSIFALLAVAAFEGDDAYWPHYIAALISIFANYIYALAQALSDLGYLLVTRSGNGPSSLFKLV